MTTGFVNSLGLKEPLAVNAGGTGVSSFTTNYGVICAGTGTTSSLQTIASLGSSGQVLTSNGASALPSFQNVPSFPAGSIVQVVSGTSTTNVAPTNSTYVTTGVTATITPASTSHHILVVGSLNVYLAFQLTDTNVNMGLQLWRGGSSIVDFGNGVEFGASPLLTTLTSGFGQGDLIYYYDAPATTSATTYTFYINLSSGASGSGGINNSGQLSSIYLIEVAK